MVFLGDFIEKAGNYSSGKQWAMSNMVWSFHRTVHLEFALKLDILEVYLSSNTSLGVEGYGAK